jgi:hypothetical protein
MPLHLRHGSACSARASCEAIRQAPTRPPSKKSHQRLIRASPARTIPGDLIGVIAPTELETVLPMSTASGRVLPLRLRRKSKAQRHIARHESRPRITGIESIEESARSGDHVPRDVLDRTTRVAVNCRILPMMRCHNACVTGVVPMKNPANSIERLRSPCPYCLRFQVPGQHKLMFTGRPCQVKRRSSISKLSTTLLAARLLASTSRLNVSHANRCELNHHCARLDGCNVLLGASCTIKRVSTAFLQLEDLR